MDVVVTQPMYRGGGPLASLLLMQVCAYGEIPPERIEEQANTLNPSGTSNGWHIVWGTDDDDPFNNATKAPVVCADDPARLHYLLSC